jgi:hypothetical protein
MKIDRLETHDRLEQFQKQSLDISECCKDLVDKRPFGLQPFYIFAHARTEDNGVDKRLIWQPRLTKPKAQTNSMLFKGYPGSDMIKVYWMIPDRLMWEQYGKGMISESQTVIESIYQFENEREKLEAPDEDDLSDEEVDKIYLSLGQQFRFEKAGYKLL